MLARLTSLRRQIVALIESVEAGRTTLGEVLDRGDRDEVAGFVYLVKVAEVMPGVGKVRARRVLESLGFGERTRVGEVPASARRSLVEALS